ncbi:cyclophilin-like fold protein [Pseudomonas guariconensis]|uniref:cyclophilin-like fold protein n=1 Tax=Pseudomonas TaxID=286 RepID=UPI002096DF17|nr:MULTISPECIES: cyclophilin-like fold protein [Pseudomonas]MCO7565547.1 cyclophilin-like fold protein [Pseudomonas mosselii]MCO7617655.1 cyclophilin-like fold protein [Pseudomonas guariconensis]
MSEITKESPMWMTGGERRFAITLADTEAAHAFAAMLPLAIDMADLNGNGKHADLPKPLPQGQRSTHDWRRTLWGLPVMGREAAPKMPAES